MKIKLIDQSNLNDLIPLVAQFRVELRKLKSQESDLDLSSANAELAEYYSMNYPIYAAYDQQNCVGYIVLKIIDTVVWVESLFTLPSYRRKYVASTLYDIAEAYAIEQGQDNLYNMIHPNNDAIIQFLNKRGYNVLNLIEVRKQYQSETNHTSVKIMDHTYKY